MGGTSHPERRLENCFYEMAWKIVQLINELEVYWKFSGSPRNWNASIGFYFRTERGPEESIAQQIYNDINEYGGFYGSKAHGVERNALLEDIRKKLRALIDQNRELYTECVFLAGQEVRE